MNKIFLVIVLIDFSGLNGLNNGLARTPPMGWMTWQRFRCTTDCAKFPNECISENLVKRTADAMVNYGYLNAGYQYLIIDDCWLSPERDEDGKLQPDFKRFPNGMKEIGNYIHSVGLKYGIYEDYGTKTCAGYPGVLGHLETDAFTFADWEVDYVKLDGCNVNISAMADGYTEFGQSLNKTGRPMVYSCSWPAYTEPDGIPGNYKVLAEICNLWRNWDDIDDSWESMKGILSFFAKNQDRLVPYAGPGHWNDPDMLLIGNFGLSYEQSKAQMGMWAILAAPLLMSTDLDTISEQMRQILLNKAVIAINQDKMGIQGKYILSKNKIHIWVRPVEPVINGYTSFAIAFLSYRVDGMPYRVNCTFSELGMLNSYGYEFQDLFEPNEKVCEINSTIITRVNPTGIRMLKATPISPY